jgi:glycolate oxidase FAD binding subunit
MDAAIAPTSSQRIATFEQQARAFLSPENIRSAAATDAIAGAQPALVVDPADEIQLAAVLKLADTADLAVIPRGGGTKVAWGNAPNRADIVLSTARLSSVIEYACSDLTVVVQSGCTITALRDTLAHHGQRLALDPLWPSRATVGGILSCNDSGALRLRFGSLRDLLIGITLALPDGTLAKSGGKVVKNVAGYDLPKLVTGALGTLGVITQATFRLHPSPKESRTISCVARDVTEAQRLLLAVQNSKLAHSALQVRFLESTEPQLDVLFEATQAGLAAQVEQLKAILAPSPIIDSGAAVWNARQELYSAAAGDHTTSALAKISILPSQIAEAFEMLTKIAANRVRFNGVFQATGLGVVHLQANPQMLSDTLSLLRLKLESTGGSVTIAHHPHAMPQLDAWGHPGDALPLMRAVKQQFDPKSTLNPGRFVGGI